MYISFKFCFVGNFIFTDLKSSILSPVLTFSAVCNAVHPARQTPF